ncbi:MAG: LPS-assembly protein LptD, partial [Alistipes sp.]|nr:LPS-assembly protein LptD [Alistipes sp.]
MVISRVKYLLSAAVVIVFAQAVVGSAMPRPAAGLRSDDSLAGSGAAAMSPAPEARPADPASMRTRQRDARRAAREESRRREAFNALPQDTRDSIAGAQIESLVEQKSDTLRRDTVRQPRAAQPFLEDPISGQNSDSLVYDVRNKMIYIYNQGDVSYQNSNLKADYMQIDMETK